MIHHILSVEYLRHRSNVTSKWQKKVRLFLVHYPYFVIFLHIPASVSRQIPVHTKTELGTCCERDDTALPWTHIRTDFIFVTCYHSLSR